MLIETTNVDIFINKKGKKNHVWEGMDYKSEF